jgi:aminoglycoside phosphotransferase (APT) family kinase protein
VLSERVARVFPLIDVERRELSRLVGEPVVRVEGVDGGLTNTLHKVTLSNAQVLVIKHHAGGDETYADEVATITTLAGILPVPELVRVDHETRAIVYRWISGITLDECRRKQPAAAHASLAEPLGRFLAWLATFEWPGQWDVTPFVMAAHARLGTDRVRERLASQMADALRKTIDTYATRLAWGKPCLSHGDLGPRNMIVQHAMGERWRIGGVIDWEAASLASPLVDIGSLFRYAQHYPPQFVTDFERGYREADGALPDDWLRTARLLDALWLVEMLDEPRELPGVYADCRMLVAKLVSDLAA